MKRKNSEGDYEFGVYEVYYDEKGNVSSWTTKSLTPTCSSAEDLEHEMNVMMKAFKQETIEYKEE